MTFSPRCLAGLFVASRIVRFWPLEALQIAENQALWITAIRRKAEVGYSRILASRTAGNGQKGTLDYN